MESVNSRIMLIMRDKNLNKNSLSKLLGVSQPSISKIEREENAPSFKLLFEILTQFPDINPSWLMTGKGDMYVGGTSTSSNDDLITTNRNLSETVRNLSETVKNLTIHK